MKCRWLLNDSAFNGDRKSQICGKDQIKLESQTEIFKVELYSGSGSKEL